jgi:TPR repeat protein
MAAADVQALLLRGDLALAAGDILTARQFFRAGADAGNGKAALRLAETYDPYFLTIMNLEPHADQARAVFWYARARELGSESAEILRKRIEASSGTAAGILPPNEPAVTAKTAGNGSAKPAAPESAPAEAKTVTAAASSTAIGRPSSPPAAASAETGREASLPPATPSAPGPAPQGGAAATAPAPPGRDGSPQPAPPSAPARRPALTAEEFAMLLARGDRLLVAGDVAAARLFYERGANAGDGTAALRMGETFDPRFLARARLGFVKGDAALADHWYGVARDLGNADVAFLLKPAGGK